MEQLQNSWNIVHENFMVFYNVFVTFVGLNNKTIVYAQYRIWIIVFWPIPYPAENASIGAIPILNIGSAHPYRYYKEKVIYEDITPCPHISKAYKSYRMSFFEKVNMQKVSCKESVCTV